MRKSKFTESQIVTTLKQVEGGRQVKDVCRELGISDATYYIWKSNYGGMEAADVRRLKDLEEENCRLKRMFAEMSLENMVAKFLRPTHHFGMKAHIGVDVKSGLVHTVTTTLANAGDVKEVDKLLNGREKTVYADAGYQGAEKRAPKRGRTWYIAAKRGSVKAMPEGELKDAVKYTEHMKAAVHAKVEHPVRVVKRQFGYQKGRFKGLVKNTAQVLTLFALANLWMVRRTLLATAGEVRL